MGPKAKESVRLASVIVPVVLVLSLGILISLGALPDTYYRLVYILSTGLLIYAINRGYYDYKRKRLAETEALLEAEKKKTLQVVASEKEKNLKELEEKKGRTKYELEIERQKKLKELEIERQKKLEELEIEKKAIKERTKELKEVEKELKERGKAIEIICKEKGEGFPWLANAFADFFYLEDLKKAARLETKENPANATAKKIIDEIAPKRREAEIRQKTYKYKLDYFKSLFPFLVDFEDVDIEEYIQYKLNRQKAEEEEAEGFDPARKWLTKDEFEKLSCAERNQLALDRYWRKQKGPWEVGRDYERYIGYLFEKEGYNVYYQGIVEGFEDLGRDLIAKKGEETLIIQCKRWKKEKTIHEKHVFQLYGTCLMYKIDNEKNLLFPTIRVKSLLITSTQLSEKARKFAKELGIEIREDVPLKPYPSIKCNVSRRKGEKIYHLPLDQQYDRVLIEEERLECYVETVKEAESLGYRRAFKWRGI